MTDGRTDRRTDGRTDRILLAIPRLHYMQRGKKSYRMRIGVRHDKPCSKINKLFGVICLYTITVECLGIESLFLVCRCISRRFRSSSYMKVIWRKVKVTGTKTCNFSMPIDTEVLSHPQIRRGNVISMQVHPQKC